MTDDRVPAQFDTISSNKRGTIKRKYAELIYEEYHRQYSSQTFERLHERGGFGIEEGFHAPRYADQVLGGSMPGQIHYGVQTRGTRLGATVSRYQEPCLGGQDHPLKYVPDELLEAARGELRAAAHWGDVAEDMIEPLADSVVMAVLPWLDAAFHVGFPRSSERPLRYIGDCRHPFGFRLMKDLTISAVIWLPIFWIGCAFWERRRRKNKQQWP